MSECNRPGLAPAIATQAVTPHEEARLVLVRDEEPSFDKVQKIARCGRSLDDSCPQQLRDAACLCHLGERGRIELAAIKPVDVTPSQCI